tara:strand:+ start:291 stop:641 length:351 start_codon:yes stop_codon:yes gene_type:complete
MYMSTITESDLTQLVAAVITAMTEVDTPESTPVPATTQDRSARRAANQTLNRRINGQLANATKAFNAGDGGACVAALEKAQALVPTHLNKDGSLAWQGTLDRIGAKAQSFAEKASA